MGILITKAHCDKKSSEPTTTTIRRCQRIASTHRTNYKNSPQLLFAFANAFRQRAHLCRRRRQEMTLEESHEKSPLISRILYEETPKNCAAPRTQRWDRIINVVAFPHTLRAHLTFHCVRPTNTGRSGRHQPRRFDMGRTCARFDAVPLKTRAHLIFKWLGKCVYIYHRIATHSTAAFWTNTVCAVCVVRETHSALTIVYSYVERKLSSPEWGCVGIPSP